MGGAGDTGRGGSKVLWSHLHWLRGENEELKPLGSSAIWPQPIPPVSPTSHLPKHLTPGKHTYSWSPCRKSCSLATPGPFWISFSCAAPLYRGFKAKLTPFPDRSESWIRAATQTRVRVQASAYLRRLVLFEHFFTPPHGQKYILHFNLAQAQAHRHTHTHKTNVLRNITHYFQW